MKSQILPNFLKEKYRYNLGEFSNTSFFVFVAEGVNDVSKKSFEQGFE